MHEAAFRRIKNYAGVIHHRAMSNSSIGNASILDVLPPLPLSYHPQIYNILYRSLEKLSIHHIQEIQHCFRILNTSPQACLPCINHHGYTIYGIRLWLLIIEQLSLSSHIFRSAEVHEWKESTYHCATKYLFLRSLSLFICNSEQQFMDVWRIHSWMSPWLLCKTVSCTLHRLF